VAPVEPAPVEAFQTEQHGGTVTDLSDVMRLWMSSIRRNYRRPIRGRSTLLLPGTLPARGRHRAP
jgi:hypothetical protein